jgi:uncharacterized protein (DUF1778 family)
MATLARFDMRLDPVVKEKAEKATALLGLSSLTEFVVRLMDEHATRIIREYESMVVKDDIFDRFMVACKEATPPNKALRDAVAFSLEREIK